VPTAGWYGKIGPFSVIRWPTAIEPVAATMTEQADMSPIRYTPN